MRAALTRSRPGAAEASRAPAPIGAWATRHSIDADEVGATDLATRELPSSVGSSNTLSVRTAQPAPACSVIDERPGVRASTEH